MLWRCYILCICAIALAACASTPPPGDFETVTRAEQITLRAGAAATLQVECPTGHLAGPAAIAPASFTVTESRAALPGVWWVTFENPARTTQPGPIRIDLTCRPAS